MPNVMAALSNICGALCSSTQSLADVHYSSAVQSRCKDAKPVEMCRVPQTPERISAICGPKFTILRGHVDKVLLLNNFFRLSIRASVAKIQPNKVVRWCPDGDFLRHFCILYIHRAACSTFQTCILNLN